MTLYYCRWYGTENYSAISYEDALAQMTRFYSEDTAKRKLATPGKTKCGNCWVIVECDYWA